MELKESEATWHSFLDKEEMTWRLRSRALWLKARDNNTKFFHHYSNYRKNRNTIWGIRNEEGRIVSSFEDKAEARIKYFQSLFKAPVRCEIMQVVSKFPTVFQKI
jgi:hypothetical protein